MAFIAPLVGAAVGGGLLGSIVTTAVGIGINLAIAYFFPQKIKGPRAESLKAQTSRYGDQITRWYGSVRTAGAVIWLKGDHVDEHVKTERQGKALGPEVTTYSYTATFAVAFAWNGPASGITRIWADDKLIFDVSFDALQYAIDHGGKGIGVAKGASITLYLGTETQQPDPLIEADKGAGMVPAWPRVVYAVIKNLPLDEFGIRVPNIEAEILQGAALATTSIDSFSASAGQYNNDTNGGYLASEDSSGNFIISALPAGTSIFTGTIGYIGSVHISDRNDVAVVGGSGDTIGFYDAATGAFTQEITGLGGSSSSQALLDDISFGGVSYMLVWVFSHELSLLTNTGTGWTSIWTATTSYSAVSSLNSLSVGPEYAYAVRGGIGGRGTDIIRVAWDTSGVLSETSVTLGALTDNAAACHYDEESDSVIVVTADGNIFVYTPDLSTLLRSNVSTSVGGIANVQPILSKRMKSGSDLIALKSNSGNDIREFRVSDLALVTHTVAGTTTWTGSGNSLAYFGVNETWGAILTVSGSGLGSFAYVWYLPRAQGQPVPVADVIEAECLFAGLTADASAVPNLMYGYGIRDSTPPRGVLEDVLRVNFVDFAQVDGIQKFFPRETAAFRSLTVAETGMALNAEPDAIQVSETYPAILDTAEQVIITYPSYDAQYRIGAQAGTTKNTNKFSDEPSQADETGAPVRIRRSRVLQFSTAQVLTDQDAARVADVIHNDLTDAGTIYKTAGGPKQMDLHPGQVINLPLDDSRTAKAVLTRMTGDTVIEMEFRKRGDSYTSEAVAQPTPYVVDSLLGLADAAPVLIDGHLLRSADSNDGFYAGVAVTSAGTFRSASIYRSEDAGATYAPWAGFTNGMIRGIAVGALPDRPHPAAIDRASSYVIAIPIGTAPDSISEDALLGSETSNGFAVWNASVGDWEYIRAASVVDNLDGTWTLSTLLRGLKGTEFAMVGHAAGAIVYHLDDQAMIRATEGDRTLSRVYVAIPTSTVFDSTGAVTFTNYGKGLRPWSPVLVSAVLDSGSGDWTFTWSRRDRLGQAWPEDGPEDPPMSEATEAYTIKFYDGGGLVVGTYASVVDSYVYSAANQTTDYGSPQTTMPTIGVAQVSAIYGDGIEMREAA